MPILCLFFFTDVWFYQAAQRDILEALDYELYVAFPDAIFEELRLSLLTIRKMLSFQDGWEIAINHAREMLSKAVRGMSKP